mmetsp:Transcript_12623/g.29298  ORF Transcript_12623/g.29298 Transcript_12623/m.29298 type:complete len:162 (+) Transcript_12623:541-1026(+)
MFVSFTQFNQDIGEWDVSNVKFMDDMFASATHFDQDIGRWDVGNVVSMDCMFQDATRFNQDIGRWNVGNVTSMVRPSPGVEFRLLPHQTHSFLCQNWMFLGASQFQQNICDWILVLGEEVECQHMFEETSCKEQDTDSCDTSSSSFCESCSISMMGLVLGV